jgi:hypothetical protein
MDSSAREQRKRRCPSSRFLTRDKENRKTKACLSAAYSIVMPVAVSFISHWVIEVDEVDEYPSGA